MDNGITGFHWLLYSTDPDADRAFFRDILGLRSVDAGGGWLIFAQPPAELAIHPGEGDFVQKQAKHNVLGATLYMMCDDIHATVKSLHAHKAHCEPVAQAEWGFHTLVQLPSGGKIGLYQPTHPTAI